MVLATTPPTLGTPQLAFVRAWAEGLDPVIARERFLALDGGGDLRSARRELNRLLEELRRVARLHGRPDIAALLLRDPEAMVERAADRPSLEEFRRGFDDDFFAESELLQLYEETYGKPDARSAVRRRQRLRERLLQALQWLQERTARPPLPSDPSHLWFDQRVSQRLAVVGIRSLSELHFWVRSNGFHWHRKVPRLGRIGAQRIVRWLRDHEASLGALPASALLPRSDLKVQQPPPAAQVGVAPIERLLMPADARCGREGFNRAPLSRCKLSAQNDLEAIRSWLAAQQPGSHTWRAYRREAERWLLWAVFEQHKALSSLDAQDCAAYRRFLASPAAHWTAPRYTPRTSPAWRPLEGALSAGSRVTSEAIVRSLCDWLVRQRYLDANPWDEVDRVAHEAVRAESLSLTVQDWSRLDAWLKSQPATHARLRLHTLLHLAGPAGLLLSELAAAELSWIRGLEGTDRLQQWGLQVPGARSGSRLVRLDSESTGLLKAYLATREVSVGADDQHRHVPLLTHLKQPDRLSQARLRDLLHRALKQCALNVYEVDKSAGERLRNASVRSLRLAAYSDNAS